MYAKIENNTVIEWPIVNLRQRLPEISLPEVLTDSNLPEGFVLVRYSAPPTYDPKLQKPVANTQPEFTDGYWQINYQIVALDPTELDQQTQQLADSVRQTRNQLLTNSDWTQTLDAPVDKAAWATYRQQLRDISTQPGFPETVNWPQPP